MFFSYDPFKVFEGSIITQGATFKKTIIRINLGFVVVCKVWNFNSHWLDAEALNNKDYHNK